MKRILLFAAVLFTSTMLFAQNKDVVDASATAVTPSKEYVETMKTLIAKIDELKTPQDFLELSNAFDRISNSEPTEWLPAYYAAFCLVNSTFITKDKSTIDATLEKADSYLTTATEISKGHSEIECLKSLAKTAAISVDPQGRGMIYSQAAGGMLALAKKLDSKNPRIYYLEAQSTYYTPEMFGGGKKAAKPKLEEALKSFNAFKPSSDIMPNWGMNICEKLLATCK